MPAVASCERCKRRPAPDLPGLWHQPRRASLASLKGDRAMTVEKIVSVGFLSENDLLKLGNSFTRHFAVPEDDIFADLIARLDEVDAQPYGKGVVLMPHPKA
jgi:hypothetical protein